MNTKTADSKPAAKAAKKQSPFFNKSGEPDFFHAGPAETPFFEQPNPPIQAKLSIGRPGDRYEQEADAMADQVVRKMGDTPGLQRGGNPLARSVTPVVNLKCDACEREEQEQPEGMEDDRSGPEMLQQKSIFESNELPERSGTDTRRVQTAAEPGASGHAPQHSPSSLQPKCEACEQEEEQQEKEDIPADGPLQMKRLSAGDAVVQRRCRECEEGDKIFLKAIDVLQCSSHDPGVKADGSRDSIVAAARGELGKVEAKQDDGTGKRVGADRLLEYFHIAAPGVWDDSIIETAGAEMPSWCGIFSVWAHKKAGKDVGNWQMGKGVSAFHTLSFTDSPQKGDIGYIDQPFQHHCIIVKVEGDTVHSIDGNSGPNSGVLEHQKPRSAYSGFMTAFGSSSAAVQKKPEYPSQALYSAADDAGDKYEKEADAMAEKLVQTQCEACASQGMVPAKRPEAELLQTKPAFESENEPVQMKGGGGISTSLEKRLLDSRGGGHPLSDNIREQMESGFGADFSGVRIHRGSHSVQMNRELNAQAFTHGNDIHFNEGKYSPETVSGRRLLAHELTHTIQQGSAQVNKPLQKQAAGEPEPVTTAKFIVEDHEVPSEDQLRKMAFIDRLSREICSAFDEATTGTPLTAQACPYIRKALDKLASKTPLQIEQLLKKYEPGVAMAETLEALFEAIRKRVITTTQNWIEKNDLSGVPPEVVAGIPAPILALATITRAMASAARTTTQIVKAASETVSAAVSEAKEVLTSIKDFFFKSKNGKASAKQSPAAVLQQLGPGRSMEAGAKSKMETAFDANFSGVEVHSDQTAGQLADEMNARAFTVGNHIAFGRGQYRPGTMVGDALMAHELAHVQQQKGFAAKDSFGQVQAGEQSLEDDADNAAVGVVGRLWGKQKDLEEGLPEKTLPALKTGLQLQRCCGGAEEPEWDKDISKLHIEIHTTTTLQEGAVDPGEAFTRDFGSFEVNLNYRRHNYPHVTSFRLLDAAGNLFDGPRVPSSAGINRFMTPPTGQYQVVAEVMTGLPNIPYLQVRRSFTVLESYHKLSGEQAKGDLAGQAGHTVKRDLMNFEQFSAILRQNAVNAAGVSPDLVTAWEAVHQKAVLLEASLDTGIDPSLSASTKTALANFYRLFRSNISNQDVYHEEETETICDVDTCGVSTTPAYTTNPFQTQDQADQNVNTMMAGGATAADWRNYLDTFYDVTNKLNRFIAGKMRDAGFTEAAQQLEQAGPISNHLRKLYRDHPNAKAVPAVFYPKLQAGLKNDAKPGSPAHYTLVGLQQRMYTWRTDDGVWHLLDITRPEKALETEESGGSAELPPRSLMTELDSAERFPEGLLHWQFEGGNADVTEMTHPWTASEVLNLISAVLAISGLVALVVASGGTAAPALLPTILFVASGLAGAAAGIAHIHESSELGTLTAESVTVDTIQIATSLLGAAAAGTGHIVRAAQVAEVAWTGNAAMTALRAQAAYRVIQGLSVLGEGANLITFTAQSLEQYEQIKKMPDGDAKQFAMQRLVGMGLITGGMSLMAIRGGWHDVSSGNTLYLDFTTINGRPTAVAHRILPEANLLAHTRLKGASTEAENFLARTDMDAATLDRFRGELSVGLSTPGISEEEIKSFVTKLSKAANQAEANAIIAEFRNNRVNVAVGGVSHGAGYDLTFHHTSQADFQNQVRTAFEGEGHIVHNGTLKPVEGGEVGQYRLQVDAADGTKVDCEVKITYQDFETGSAIGAGTTAPGASQGPARNVVRWDPDAKKWIIRIEVDQRLAPKDIRRAVGHELDEAGDVVHRLNATPEAADQAKIAALQQPGLMGADGKMTSHDLATLREIDYLLSQQATNPSAGESLSALLRELGVTGDRAQFQNRLTKILSSGIIDESRMVMLEAWATYDMAMTRGSRLSRMSRAEFIDEYLNGKRFDEGGSYRWYNLETEGTTNKRQFFTDAEMADHAKAFDRLTGESSTSSFKQYYDMLVREGLADEPKVRKRLSELMAGSRGQDLDFVRHELKQTYRDAVINHVTNRSRVMRAHPGMTFEEASHVEMMRITEDLNSSDKGSLAEEWYQRVFAPTSVPHVRVAGPSGTVRYPDLINPDGTLRDLKFISGELSAREIEQFDDYRKMVGSDVTIPNSAGVDTTVRVKRVEYSFINPEGVKANASWMHDQLISSSGGLTFEIFNAKGQRRIVNVNGVWDITGTKVAGLDFLTNETMLKNWLNP